MPIKIRGATSGVDADVETLSKALRTTLAPTDYGDGGSYLLTSTSGTMAAGLGAAAPIYAFRVTSASLLVVIRRIRLAAWSLTGFAAGTGLFTVYRATSWSAADTGGTTDTLTTVNGKMRSSMPSIAAISEIRHSSTATLSAGTRTLGAQPMESLTVNVTTSANTPFVTSTNLFSRAPGEYPLVLDEEEGFVVQATVPATGTWVFTLTTEWLETTSFVP